MNKPSKNQLELFSLVPYTRDRAAATVVKPAPLQTAEKFNFALQHYAPIESGQEYQYAILDWITGLTGDSQRQATKSWGNMKNQLSISIGQLDYLASDGKTYQSDYTNAKGLYMVAQSLRVTTARPQLKEIRNFLASSAAWVELIARDRAAATVAVKQLSKRHAIREEGVKKRKVFTKTAQETHITGKPRYDILTNVIYHKIGRTVSEQYAAREIADLLGLTDKETKRMRDFFNPLLDSAISMAEEASTLRMQTSGRKLSTDEQIAIVKQCARTVAPVAWELANMAGVDLVTNQPLLGKGQ